MGKETPLPDLSSQLLSLTKTMAASKKSKGQKMDLGTFLTDSSRHGDPTLAQLDR